MTRGRRRHVPPDLTSLFDVLFIVIFVALIRAAAAEHAEAAEAATLAARATPPATPAPPPPPLDPHALHARAVATLDADLTARPTVVVRVSAAGTVSAVETAGEVRPLDVPLLEHSSDPDVALAYLGDRSTELHACRIAALHLGVADLSRYLVILAPASAVVDLPHALYAGLRRDVDRCLAEQHAIAAIVAPEPAP